jgi:hypothetical protein
VVPLLSRGWQHGYSAKARQADRANAQSIYSLMSDLNPLSYSLFISALIFGPWHANLFLEKLEEVFKKIQK